MSGDGVPEYLAVIPGGQLIILTIYKNKVKVLAVLQTTSIMPDVYYNRQNNTFTIAASITARLTSRNVYKIQKGKLYRLATLSDAIGQMNGYGYVPVNRYLNGKLVSKTNITDITKNTVKICRLLTGRERRNKFGQ